MRDEGWAQTVRRVPPQLRGIAAARKLPPARGCDRFLVFTRFRAARQVRNPGRLPVQGGIEQRGDLFLGHRGQGGWRGLDDWGRRGGDRFEAGGFGLGCR
jgi:hypothetical protein